MHGPRYQKKTIENALKAGYLDESFSFEDTAIAKHAKLSLLIQKEMSVSVNLSVTDSLYTNLMKEDAVTTVFE